MHTLRQFVASFVSFVAWVVVVVCWIHPREFRGFALVLAMRVRVEMQVLKTAGGAATAELVVRFL